MKNTLCLIASIMIVISLSSCTVRIPLSISERAPIWLNEPISKIESPDGTTTTFDGKGAHFVINEVAVTGLTRDSSTITVDVNRSDTLFSPNGYDWTVSNLFIQEYPFEIYDKALIINGLRKDTIEKIKQSYKIPPSNIIDFAPNVGHITDFKLALSGTKRFSNDVIIPLEKGSKLFREKVDLGLTIGTVSVILLCLMAAIIFIGMPALGKIYIGLPGMLWR